MTANMAMRAGGPRDVASESSGEGEFPSGRGMRREGAGAKGGEVKVVGGGARGGLTAALHACKVSFWEGTEART